jgi:hypothetical protein
VEAGFDRGHLRARAGGVGAVQVTSLPNLRALDVAQAARIWLAAEAADMRCGFDRLAVVFQTRRTAPYAPCYAQLARVAPPRGEAARPTSAWRQRHVRTCYFTAHRLSTGGNWGDPAVHGWVNMGKDG